MPAPPSPWTEKWNARNPVLVNYEYPFLYSHSYSLYLYSRRVCGTAALCSPSVQWGGGKLFAKLLHLCSLRRSWRRQLMDMEHPFAFASQVSSGAFKVFPAYLQLASISPVQCKISSRNELNCNTFWCTIRSYLCIIKSNTCSEALMSPLQLNYSAARAERINAKVLNGQNNVHVNGQTKVHAYHIHTSASPSPLLLPPLAVWHARNAF